MYCLVDFDLEAPSLQTFNLPMPPKPSLGIVDYITHYLATDEAPDVEEYVYSSPGMSEWGDRLWIMPAGKQDGKYGQRFSAINWQRLYAERDGYLLFEDLKAQWKRHVEPDYVLIDSRTGHNEEGGILYTPATRCCHYLVLSERTESIWFKEGRVRHPERG